MGIELGKTTGKINLTNATGNIELNASAENVELTNSSDNIELNGVSGDIELVIKGGGSSVEIDDTLSIAGAAADAAATGEALGELEAAQPDWLVEDTTSHAYIKNKPTYTTIMPSLSCDYKSDFVVGNNLIMEINKYYTNSFTYDSFYDTTKSIQPVVTYKVANGREYTVEFSAWANGNLYKTINGATFNVIINRDDMSEFDKAKFPVYGVYVEFGNQANLERTQAVKVEMLRYVKINKRYLPRDTAYLDDIPEVAQPDFTITDKDSLGFIKNKPCSFNEVSFLSSGEMSEFKVGTNLLFEIGKSYTRYFTLDYINNSDNIYSPALSIKTLVFGTEMEIEGFLTTFTPMADGINLTGAVSSATGYVITNTSVLSAEDKTKFPKTGVYLEFTQEAIDAKSIISARVKTTQFNKLDRRYLPVGIAYKEDIPEPGGSEVELDTTLSKEGVAADAKATGDAIKTKTNIKYYAFDIATLQANGVAAAATNISSPNSGSYTLNINITIVPTIFENGVETKIIDAPFKFLNINGAVWNNKNEFRGVGISSPAIAQTLGINDILWFESMGNVMSNFGLARENFTYKFFDNSRGYPQGTITIQMSAFTTNYSAAQQVKGLWDAMFATPGTKIIFEYENQENIETYESRYLLEAAPIVNI
jgi:hypothetical protein